MTIGKCEIGTLFSLGNSLTSSEPVAQSWSWDCLIVIPLRGRILHTVIFVGLESNKLLPS